MHGFSALLQLASIHGRRRKYTDFGFGRVKLENAPILKWMPLPIALASLVATQESLHHEPNPRWDCQPCESRHQLCICYPHLHDQQDIVAEDYKMKQEHLYMKLLEQRISQLEAQIQGSSVTTPTKQVIILLEHSFQPLLTLL